MENIEPGKIKLGSHPSPFQKRGQTLAEYGLILALVSVAVIAILPLVGSDLKNIYITITSAISPTPTPQPNPGPIHRDD